jgi:uncharacterized protein YjcR
MGEYGEISYANSRKMLERAEEARKFIPYKHWQHLHDDDIRVEFPDRPTRDLASEYDVNYYTLSRRATRLGVSKSDKFMHASWKKGSAARIKVKGEARKQYMAAVDKYMQAHYHDTSNAELAQLFGVDVKTVRRWARRLGLQKSEAFMFAVRSRGMKNRIYYTPEQLAWRDRRIAEVYPDADRGTIRRLAEELGISVKTLSSVANANGVRRSKAAHAEAMRRAWDGKRKYGHDVIASLAVYFSGHSNQECAEKYAIKASIISQLAFKYGWRKDKEYIRDLYSRLARQQHERKKQQSNKQISS